MSQTLKRHTAFFTDKRGLAKAAEDEAIRPAWLIILVIVLLALCVLGFGLVL